MADLVESLLKDIPKDLEFKVDIPSKGKFYNSFDPVKGVRVKPFTFANEMEMARKLKDKSFTPVDFILEKCTFGVDVNELLAMDNFAILLKIREVSFGAEYKVVAVCPTCGTENELQFNLGELPVEHVPDTLTDPQEIELPILKIKVKVRFPRKLELDLVDSEGLDKHLWRFVIALGLEDGSFTEDKVIIAKLVSDPRFPLKDIKTIIKAISGMDYGVQTNAKYKCCKESCQEVNETVFGINSDFFSWS